MGKGLFQSKTFWVNGLTALVALGTYVMDSQLFVQHPEVVAVAGVVIGSLNIVLRFITKEPITGVRKAK